MTPEACRLCGNIADLQLSHVIPAFVYRWMRDTSGNGHIRNAAEPNLRVQDGEKRHWLCSVCEGRFNRAETTFATRIFHPYTDRKGVRFRYGPWLMHFGISVCWRILRLYKEENHLDHYPAEMLPDLDEAEVVWKDFLLGRRRNPRQFELHVLPLEAIESAAGSGVPPNIDRYLMRAIDMDVVQSDSTAYVYAKLGRFAFLGFTRLKHPKQWIGTKVHAAEGVIEPRDYTVPHQLWKYLAHKAQQMGALTVSPRQQKKIEQAFLANMEKVADSDQMRALQQDVRLFGEAAVFPDETGKPGA